jgi:hypothetical protein
LAITVRRRIPIIAMNNGPKPAAPVMPAAVAH